MVEVDVLHYDSLPFPHFAQPTYEAGFSFDSDRQIHLDERSLRVYAPPADPRHTCYDLNDGFEQFRPSKQPDLLDPLLSWSTSNRRHHKASVDSACDLKTELFRGADFLVWRGSLTRVAHTPYENRDGWCLAVRRCGDVILLCEYETDEKREKEARMDERGRRMSYWGYRFENFVARPTDDAPLAAAVDTSVQFCGVFGGRLGAHRLLYGAEMDCRDCAGGEFVELKTNRLCGGDRQLKSFRQLKAAKWWLQSFLVGVRTIVVGERDDAGVARCVRRVDVAQLERDARGYWSAAVCLNFLAAVLEHVRRAAADEHTLYVLEWRVGQPRVALRPATHQESLKYTFFDAWRESLLFGCTNQK